MVKKPEDPQPEAALGVPRRSVRGGGKVKGARNTVLRVNMAVLSARREPSAGQEGGRGEHLSLLTQRWKEKFWKK